MTMTTPVRSRCGRTLAMPVADGPADCPSCGESFTLLSDGAGGFLLFGFDDLVRPNADTYPPLRHIRAEDIAAATKAGHTSVIGV